MGSAKFCQNVASLGSAKYVVQNIASLGSAKYVIQNIASLGSALCVIQNIASLGSAKHVIQNVASLGSLKCVIQNIASHVSLGPAKYVIFEVCGQRTSDPSSVRSNFCLLSTPGSWLEGVSNKYGS